MEGTTPPLRVHDKTVSAYLSKWVWDYARYQYQGRKLSDLISQVTSQTAYADEELKKLVANHGDKLTVLSNWQRKKTINLGTSDFEDFLTPKMLHDVDVIDNDNLLTVMVSMSRDVEKEFLANYSSNSGWAKDIASYGLPEDRDAEKGSPVVPNSAKKVFGNVDQVLFAITVLRGHTCTGAMDLEGNYVAGEIVDYVEPLRTAFREKRCTLRPLVFDPTKATGVDANLNQAKVEVDQSSSVITRWCSAHFGEIFSAFVHLRVISAYVESVMRYGVPANFCTMLLHPDAKRSTEALAAVTASVIKAQPLLMHEDEDVDDIEDEDTPDALPYVCLRVPLLGQGVL